MTAIGLRDEVAMTLATERQGTTMPGTERPGMVLVTAVAPHKAGPPPKQGPDTRIRYLPGQQYWLAQERVEAAVLRGIVHVVGSLSVDWFTAPGRILSPWPDEERPLTRQAQPVSLRIVQGCGYDPGSAAYRFHSAVNQCTTHASAFARWGQSNPYCDLRQYDGERDGAVIRQALLEADVVHCHMDYLLLNNSGLQKRPRQLLIRHYHGSVLPEDVPRLGYWTHLDPRADWQRGAKLVGARLSFYAEAERLSQEIGQPVEVEWLPITVPVARYLALPTRPPDGEYWIAHSPTKRRYKGSDVFARVIKALRKKGLPVRGVMIEGMGQAQALEMKRRCDATFDSFWLGIQTSGLEGAAMGQPVIAGDPEVRDLHQQHVGQVPYTYANDEAALKLAIERLVTDEAFRAAEAERAHRYCVAYHDYPAVAARYESLLAKWLGREQAEAA